MPPHATALQLALPYRAWLSALGMQLVAYSTSTSTSLGPSSLLRSGSASSTNGSNSSSSSKHKDILSVPADGKGSAAFNSNTSKHKCWQPVLVAYGSDGSGQETLSSGREVVRSSTAALSLWAIEAYGKDVAVLSDPACLLQLRCSSKASDVVAFAKVSVPHHMRKSMCKILHACGVHGWLPC